MRFFFPLLSLAFLLSACTSLHHLSPKEKKEIHHLLSTPPLSDHHKGLAVWDVAQKQWVYRYHAEHNFTPASNTKILTLYTAIRVLADSSALCDTASRGDTLLLRPNGNGILLHPDFVYLQPDWQTILRTKPYTHITIVPRPIRNDRFGPGWSWADYRYYYQAEVSALPVYSNLLWACWDSVAQNLSIHPEFFAPFSRVYRDSSISTMSINRLEYSNLFDIRISPSCPDSMIQLAPFIMDEYSISRILADTLGLPVSFSYSPTNQEFQPFHQVPLDTIFRKMMWESDNFLAEQLLLQSSGVIGDTLSTKAVIDYMFSHEFLAYAKRMQWVDGSGLSRYNLVRPEIMVNILAAIADSVGYENIPSYFPTGGKTGTISDWYAADPSYVFAKTGTLSNHHALSGFLRTKEGEWLIFSFYHDNYLGSSRRIKPGMEKILRYLRDHY